MCIRDRCQSSARLRYHAGAMISRPQTSRPKQADPRPAPRLYLVTPPVADAQAFSVTLAAALAAGDVAAVLLRLAEGDERTQINRAKTLSPAVQDKGAALLLDGHADLVARAGADGAHLTGIAAVSYTHLRAHETVLDLVCRLLLE